MAKKDKKKQKKQAGDWSDDEPATKPAAATAQDDDASEGEDLPSMAASASRFSFADMDNGNGNGNNDDEDDDEDGGGLMATIANSQKSKKDKKKAKKGKAAPIPEDDEEELEDGNNDAAANVDLESKAPIEMTADQLMEEEFGPEKPKKGGKKGGNKKQKKGQQQPDYDEDDFLNEQVKSMSVGDKAAAAEETPATTTTATKESKSAPVEAEDAAEDEEDDGAPKLLSKKEKERLKKEKEKAKKKAQAAAKKGAAAEAATVDPAVVAISMAAATEEAKEINGEDGEAAEGASSKNKKKKKKGGAAKDEALAPAAAAAAAPAAGKKVPAHIAALREAMAKQKAAEEEAKRKEEDERRRIEEEENRLAELERQKEEEKKRKKEKEKAKIEQAKKEGRYMTPKQKQEAAAAAARRDAMIASGQITVEGLNNDDDSSSKPKKVSYGKKKPQQKKGSASPAVAASEASAATASPHDEVPTITKDPTRTEEHEPDDKQAAAAAEEEKDDWDASSADEAKVNPVAALAKDEESDMDDWDASSASEKEDEPVKKQPAPSAAATKISAKPAAPGAAEAKKPQTNGTAKPAATPAQDKAAPAKAAPATKAVPAKAVPAAAAKGKATAKPAAKEQESSEEESSEEEDSDSDDDSDDDDSSDEDSSDEEARISANKRMTAQRKAEAAARRDQQRKDAIAAGSKDDLRSPICCILGHVDTGKTKLLDKIRQTNVQEGEAGGITQQIGATYFPMEIIQQKTQVLGEHDLKEYRLPGLLVIDTPGHESFTNLRTRGSSLCNIAILVVDIMHGLEPQTLESIRLLRAGKTPFIVALNKIDRLYGWDSTPNGDFRGSLARQGKAVQNEFAKRLGETQLAFAEQGLNAIPYYDNTNFAKNVSLVPTSAHTGEGIPDMLMLIIKLTQERMSSQLMYISELECTVLEVKVIEGLGTTLDVILSNGVLHEGDKIVVCGLNGPIVTQIRAILTPQPLKELRIKGQYVHHQEVKAALGIKLVAPDLEKAIAGSKLLVCGPDDDEEYLKEEVMEVLQTLTSSVDKSGKGVYVQASTLGSLEALLEFLRTSKIPVSGINIGPVHKKDITRCAVMLDRAPEFAVLLAFDVPVDKDAEKMAEELNLKIFKADIIYHLFDAFTKHNAEVLEAKRKDSAPNAIWPCKLKILKCFAKRDPIIVGCDVVEGQTVRVGTPVCVVKIHPETKQKTIIKLGKITSLEINHTAKDIVKKSQVGAGVAVKIEHAVYESAKQFGRNFDENDLIVSMLSRSSIDTLKTLFRDDVAKDDWVLIKQMKSLLDIP